jgi:hypothetical protein
MKSLAQKRFELFQEKNKKLLVYGIKNGYIQFYDEELLEKLRNIYFGGLPASIVLLCDGMCNGYCYDRGYLLSQAFVDTDDEIELLYGDINSLKLNPAFFNDGPMYADYCVLYRKTKDGRELIYDTSAGLIYDMDYYLKMENLKIRKKNSKESIKRLMELEAYYHPEDPEEGKYITPMLFPIFELLYGKDTEMYTRLGGNLLKREIELYKQKIDYDSVCKEVEEDMLRLGMKV